MIERWRTWFLTEWSDLVTKHPYWVIVISLLLTALSLLVTLVGIPLGPGLRLGPLGFQSDRNDLLSQDLDWNQRFIHWYRTFEGINDLIVVVDAWGSDGRNDPGDEERARALVDELAAALDASPWTRQVTWRYAATDAHPSAMRLLGMADFRQQIEEIAASQPMLAASTPEELFADILRQIQREAAGLASVTEESEAEAVAGLNELARMVDAMAQVLGTPLDEPVDFGRLMNGTDAMGWQYFVSDNGRHFYIRVSPVLETGTISAAERAIAETRAIISEVSARHPEVEVGLTGVEVVEADETQVAMVDSTISSVVAAIIISALLILAFHSWRLPLIAMVSLLVGIAWSFGFVTVSIGHLQVLSVVFAVILLGLGIAFGIHLASRFEMVRHAYPDTTEGFMAAMRDAFLTMGPGIITGAVTTAAAFAAVMFNDFKGLAEMGAIAAGGIMLCLVAMLTLFPALLRRYERRHRHIFPVAKRKFIVFDVRWVMPFARHPIATLIGLAIVTAAAAVSASQIRFDYNLLNLVPQGVSSVEWQARLINDGGRTLWYAVSIVDDMDEARRLAEQYRRLDVVDDVGGVGLLFPKDEAEKLELIRQTRAALEPALTAAVQGQPVPGATPSEQPGSPALPGQLESPPASGVPGQTPHLAEQPQLIQQMTAVRTFFTFARLAPANQRPPAAILAAMDGVSQAIGRAVAAISDLPRDEQEQRIARLRSAWGAWRQENARLIDAALSTQPLTIEALPESIRGMYHNAEQGVYALEIYPNLPPGQTDPLEPVFLRRFVEALQQIDPEVTGASPQFHLSGDLIWDSYRLAGLLAIAAVFVLVLLDFGSIWDALLSLAPVVIGFVWALGIMRLVGLDLNPANIIVLPLVFGMGVDSGVHIIHRYRQDPVQRPLGLTAGTGKAITITTLTAIIGFASMIPARHLGIRSLGITLSLSLAMVLLACWVLMPAWLEIRERRRKRPTQAKASGQ